MSEPGNGNFPPQPQDNGGFFTQEPDVPQDSAFHQPSPTVQGKPKKNRIGLITGAVLGGVILLGGGAYAATSLMNTVGDKDIAKVAPANTKVFLQVDLDPSNEQKVSALALVNKIDKFSKDDDANIKDKDVKELATDIIFDDLDYETEVKPWVGNKVAFAAWDVDVNETDYNDAYDAVDPYKKKSSSVDPELEDLMDPELSTEEYIDKYGSEDPIDEYYDDEYLNGEYDNLDEKDALNEEIAIDRASDVEKTNKTASEKNKFVLVYEITDAKKAQIAVDKAKEKSKDKDTAFVIDNGYLVIGKDAATLDAYTANMKEDNLSSNANYKSDIKELGGDNISSSWVDLNGIGIEELAEKSSGQIIDKNQKVEGRIVTGLSLQTDGVSLRTKVIGLKDAADTSKIELDKGLNGIQNISSDTMAVVTISDLPKIIEFSLSKVRDSDRQESLDSSLEELGLDAPDAFKKLFGSETTVSITNAGDDSFNLSVDSEDSDEGFTKEIFGELGDVKVVKDGNTVKSKVLMGSDEGKDPSNDKLGDKAAFKSALPDLDKAQFALYADLDAINAIGDSKIEDESLGVIGVTGTHDTKKNVSDVLVKWAF